ncbi:protein SCO1/2 [Roseivivax lentus]|uniref:Protein SCO1/2 n=1 Tax=Roseivivax lentus TaxID=633194 RepID=A0A1N7NG15_9RHOB|nr:SCO family protein [Roseivivax lentus]SIS97178.1 protein SCO1/2 [Roseivivax lentus]
MRRLAPLLALCLAAGGAASETPAPAPFPIALGGPFTLTDQSGAPRTEAAPGADLQLVFFGYANCRSICAVALPTMAAAADTLAAGGIDARPVMITVDPDHDTVATIGPPLARFHPAFEGLTGSAADLKPVYDLFAVEHEVLFTDPSGQPVYAHGSHIYLLDGDGAFLTLLPPILGLDRIAEIAKGYVRR